MPFLQCVKANFNNLGALQIQILGEIIQLYNLYMNVRHILVMHSQCPHRASEIFTHSPEHITSQKMCINNNMNDV